MKEFGLAWALWIPVLSVGCVSEQDHGERSDGGSDAREMDDGARSGDDGDDGGAVADASTSASDGISFSLDDGRRVLEREGLAITICQTPGFHGSWQVQGSDPLYDVRVALNAYTGPGRYRGSPTAVIVELGSYESGAYDYADNQVNGCEVTIDASQTTAQVFCARLLWADGSVAGQLRATLRCSENEG
jgi:hypothetical protein